MQKVINMFPMNVLIELPSNYNSHYNNSKKKNVLGPSRFGLQNPWKSNHEHK